MAESSSSKPETASLGADAWAGGGDLGGAPADGDAKDDGGGGRCGGAWRKLPPAGATGRDGGPAGRDAAGGGKSSSLSSLPLVRRGLASARGFAGDY
jgi:hypothetical protein